MKTLILVLMTSSVSMAAQTFHSQYETRIGNTTFGNNGQYEQKIGNTTFGSNGSYSNTIGNTTYTTPPTFNGRMPLPSNNAFNSDND